MKRTPRHIPSQPGPHHFEPLNLDTLGSSTSSAHAHPTRDTRDEPRQLISPTEAIDKLLTADLARGHCATNTLDTSTLTAPLSSITPKPVSWLWPNFIPRGALTLLDGDPGIGTSLVALTLAAAVSSGIPFADQPEQTSLAQGHVLLLSPHADPASTLAPRLSTAGADLAHIHFLTTLPMNPFPEFQSAKYTTRPFILPRDLSVLEALIQHHHASLLILDHLSALMPSSPLSLLAHPKLPYTDARAADSPDLFTALAHIASATDCAIVLVRHTTRGRPLPERYGTAPVQLLLLPDPRAFDQRLLCTAKNTLSAPAPNQTYQIVPTAQGAPHLHWLASNLAPTLALHQAAYSSLSPNRQAILRTLTQAPDPLGPQDIATQTGLSYDLARRLLARMAEAKEIARYAYGIYTSLDHPCLASRPPLPKYSLSNPTPAIQDPLAPQSASPLSTPTSPATPILPPAPLMPPSAPYAPSPDNPTPFSTSAPLPVTSIPHDALKASSIIPPPGLSAPPLPGNHTPFSQNSTTSPAESVPPDSDPPGQPLTCHSPGRGGRSPSNSHAHRRPIPLSCDQVGERPPGPNDHKGSPTISDSSDSNPVASDPPLLALPDSSSAPPIPSIPPDPSPPFISLPYHRQPLLHLLGPLPRPNQPKIP